MAPRTSRLRWALVALVGPACSLPAVSDYAKRTNDAGPPVADAGPSGDATPAPTSTMTSDAGPAADSGPASFTCPTNALFCDDFEATPIGAHWDSTDLEQGGTITALTLPDGGHALSAHAPARKASTLIRAYQQKALLTQPYASVTVALDLQIAALTNVGIVDLDFVRYQSPFYRVGLRVADYNEGFFLHAYGDSIGGGATAGGDNPITKVVAEQWTHVVFSLSYDDLKNGHGRLSFDGNVVYDGPIDSSAYANQPAFAEAGIVTTENDGAGDETFNVDHFTVTSP